MDSEFIELAKAVFTKYELDPTGVMFLGYPIESLNKEELRVALIASAKETEYWKGRSRGSPIYT